MNIELIQKLQYSYAGQHETHPLPLPLKDSLQLISAFFKHNTTNKLCLVFPTKEYAAQWLSIPTVLFLIESDFAQYKNEITESYKQYKPGEKLILNNKAIVEWVGIKGNNLKGPTFKTKKTSKASGVEITIRFSDVLILQKAPINKQALSSQKRVISALPSRCVIPIERLLNIDAHGNTEFIRNNICLVSKFKSYDESIANILINHNAIPDYFKYGKIDGNGNVDEKSPIIVSNNLLNLFLYLAQSKAVSTIIIDGFSAINERRSDFSDIDLKFNIPTILITDLSEIDTFEDIVSLGFEFFNFTKDNIDVKLYSSHSPFHSFEHKISKYISFKFQRLLCNDLELETISNKLHSLPKDDSNNDLNKLKVSLIQLSNLLSRVCYVPLEMEIANFSQNISSIESHFLKCKWWLGEATKLIEETILLLKKFVHKVAENKTEKCTMLAELMELNYDFIICPTEMEAISLRKYITTATTSVISVADVNDSLLSEKNVKAILTGWPKSNNFNRILASFLFSELTVLFYQFENRYYTSLQKRNRRNNENIKATISKDGVRSNGKESKPKGFEELYSSDEDVETTSENTFDIVAFELNLDNTQYSKYSAKGNLAESCKAKRIDFENNTFIYATESHKFIEINELIDSAKSNPNIHSKKVEALQPSDVIAFINTDRDVLVELVERTAKPDELARVKEWIDLWKNLLRGYYVSTGNDFKKLVEELRKYCCKKHEVTIRTWLQDDNKIGPDDDADLISIALLAESELLNKNVATVRKAISQMTSWRMRASDMVRDKIKNKLMVIARQPIINSSVEIQDLGRVEILKVSELKKESEEIDKKFVNRLLKKEII